MTTATKRPTVTQRLARLEERSEALEFNYNVLLSVVMSPDGSPESRAETTPEANPATEGEIEAIKDRIRAIHRLDAAPLQWMTKPGSMSPVAAEPGMWAITCTGCKYETRWNDGDPAPTPCPTVRALQG